MDDAVEDDHGVHSDHHTQSGADHEVTDLIQTDQQHTHDDAHQTAHANTDPERLALTTGQERTQRPRFHILQQICSNHKGRNASSYEAADEHVKLQSTADPKSTFTDFFPRKHKNKPMKMITALTIMR